MNILSKFKLIFKLAIIVAVSSAYADTTAIDCTQANLSQKLAEVKLQGISDTLQRETWQVQPLENYIGIYQGYHRILIDYINSRTDWDYNQRKNFYEQEVLKFINQFRLTRTAEYESKSAVVSRDHSCTSGGPSGKDCKYKCVTPPSSDLYTKNDEKFLRVSGTNKGTKVSKDGKSACLKMTVAGKGRNRGTLYATYRWRPEAIKRNVDEETAALRRAFDSCKCEAIAI